MIELRNITKKFGDRVIVEDFSFKFPDKGVVAIVGESGSGKSTLLNLISGLDKGFEGKANIIGEDLGKLNHRKLSNFRLKNIGYVFQNFNLINLDTVFNNVFLPLDTISSSKIKIKKQRVNDCIKTVGLYKLSKTRVNKLSGGEKQRVAIARSIVNDPKIILCDEPTGNLDPETAENIITLLKEITRTGTAVVMSTHNIPMLDKIPGIVYRCEDGTLTEVK